MKNEDLWKPTKYVLRKQKLIASRNNREVMVGSRLMADLVADQYGRKLPTYAGGDLLDLGCGQAPLYATYRSHVDSITCVDWVKSPHNIDHIDIACDLSKPLPIDNNQFDTIILSDVLEHIPEPKFLVSELFRILRPEGILFLNVPFYYCIHEAPHDYYRYTRHALEYFLEENDFELLEITPIGGSVEIISDILSKHFQFIPIIGKPLSSFLQATARFFSKTLLGIKIKNVTSKNFPFGYFVIAKKLL